MLYGLLVALLRLSCAREGEEDILCRRLIIRSLPFNFRPGPSTAWEGCSSLMGAGIGGMVDGSAILLCSRVGKGRVEDMVIERHVSVAIGEVGGWQNVRR